MMPSAAQWELWDALAFLTITAIATGAIIDHRRRTNRAQQPPGRHTAPHDCQPPGLGPGAPWPPPDAWRCPNCYYSSPPATKPACSPHRDGGQQTRSTGDTDT